MTIGTDLSLDEQSKGRTLAECVDAILRIVPPSPTINEDEARRALLALSSKELTQLCDQLIEVEKRSQEIGVRPGISLDVLMVSEEMRAIKDRQRSALMRLAVIKELRGAQSNTEETGLLPDNPSEDRRQPVIKPISLKTPSP